MQQEKYVLKVIEPKANCAFKLEGTLTEILKILVEKGMIDLKKGKPFCN